jgi:adenosylcobinamide-phosphate guanylyltransferase
VDALLMCGGEGSRLERGEKPLFEVSRTPMVDRVLGALRDSSVDEVVGVTSPQTPETTAHLEDRGVSVLEGDGSGYVADLSAGLARVGSPAVTVAADLPLLAGALVDRAIEIERSKGGSLTVCVPAALKETLGVSTDTTRTVAGHAVAPTGLNVVDGKDDAVHVSYDARLAVNVNRPDDAAVAEVFARGP